LGRVIFVLILALIVLGLNIGGHKLANAGTGLIAPARQVAASTGIAPQSFKVTLVGKIAGKYEIRMRLRRDGESLLGSYSYEKSGQVLNLEGTIDDSGNFTISEEFRDKKTGVFKGRLTVTAVAGEQTMRLEGTWSKPDGTNKMPFSLTEPRFDLGGLKLIRKNINEESKKPRYSVKVEYPQVEGSSDPRIEKFNRHILALVSKQINTFKGEAVEAGIGLPDSDVGSGLQIDYEVTLATSKLISITFTASPYMAGAAHPNHYALVVNYDLAAGKPIVLADMFRPNSDFLRAISSYCIAQLKKRLGEFSDPDWINGGASAKPENYTNWNITRNGILITFDPYQVAAYAVGAQTVVVPYEVLRGLLAADSPIANLLK
jgi:hypothetical protein